MTLDFTCSLNKPLKSHYQLILISFIKDISLRALRDLFKKSIILINLYQYI